MGICFIDQKNVQVEGGGDERWKSNPIEIANDE